MRHTWRFTLLPTPHTSAGPTHVRSPALSSSLETTTTLPESTAGQHAASIRTTLSDMGYPQNPTIIMCDNTSAIGIATDSIKLKRSKAIDMRFHWIRVRVRQSQFTIAYIPTSQNLADYFSKNLPNDLHAQFHPFLVRTSTNASETPASS
jgi:hypothetical protein